MDLSYLELSSIRLLLLGGSVPVFVYLFICAVKHLYAVERYYKRSARKTARKIQKESNLNLCRQNLNAINPYSFEELVLIALSKSSLVKRTWNTKYSNDGGLDGFARTTRGLTIGVQSKRYKDGYIRLNDIRKHFFICRRRKIIPIFAYVGRVSVNTQREARSMGVLLINEDELITLIKTGQCYKLKAHLA